MASVMGGTRCFQYMWADAGLSGFETLASLNPMRFGRGKREVFLEGKSRWDFGERDGWWLGLYDQLRGRKMMDEDG